MSHAILFLDTNHGFGGDTQALLNMLEAMARHGLKAAVACVAGSECQRRVSTLGTATVIPLALAQRAHCGRRQFATQLLRAAWTLDRFCRREEVRLVHLNTNVAGTAQMLAIALRTAGLGRRKLVYHAHCTPKNDRLTRTVLSMADQVWAVSHYTANQHTDAGVPADRVRLLPNLVRRPTMGTENELPAWRTRLGLDAHVPLLVCVGRLSPNKGQDIAIRALAQARHREAHLILAGDDRVADGNSGYRAHLAALAIECGVADRVHLVGHVSNGAALLAEADLALVPSDDESFCLVAAESIMAGVPTIASHRSALVEVVATTAGLPTVERTPEAFAAAIDAQLAGELAGDVQLAGQRLEAAYGASRFEKRLLELVAELLPQTHSALSTPIEALRHV